MKTNKLRAILSKNYNKANCKQGANVQSKPLRIALTLACLACAAIIGTACAMLLAAPQKSETQAYILRELEGKIALFDAQTQQLRQEYSVYTQLLPQGDIDALRVGIVVQTPQELDRLLEDFGA